jgi:hypothetical protein
MARSPLFQLFFIRLFFLYQLFQAAADTQQRLGQMTRGRLRNREAEIKSFIL